MQAGIEEQTAMEMRMAGARGPQTGREQGKTADLVLRIQAVFEAGGQVSPFKGAQGSS